MAYVVLVVDQMLAVATMRAPWAGEYTAWYVPGMTAWREPTRREDVGGLAPCRTLSMGMPRASGNYVILADQVSLPPPQGSASG